MPLTTKQIVDAHCHQMHPDLFPETPAIKHILKSWADRDKMMKRQEFWLTVIDAGIRPPDITSDAYTFVTVRHGYGSDVPAGKHGEIDEQGTIKAISKVVKWLRSQGHPVTKSYDDYFFRITTVVDGEKYEFLANRESVCTAVVVGQKTIPATEAKVVDELKWECEKLSFLGIDDNE